jgi:two-component system response regulator QseB
MRILLVDDDVPLGEGIRTALKSERYTIDWVRDGEAALHAMSVESFDLVVLDLGLPKMDGLQVLRRARADGNAVPVLALTARDATSDRIAGLDAGADDYLVKPFDVEELKARLRALLRRSFNRPQPALEHRGITIDPIDQTIDWRGGSVVLPRKEFLLLHKLIAQPGRVMTRDNLQQALYGWNEEIESNALEVHVHRLRRKFFTDLIRTVRGVGYVADKG